MRETLRSLERYDRRLVSVTADITKRSGVNRLRDVALSQFEHVDIVVNGVGEHLRSSSPFENSREEQWQALYEVNLLHVFRVTQAFLPGMIAKGWGRIVNFSSVEGIRSGPHIAVYSAFKRAVDGFTKSLAVDVARFGVLANAIAVDKTRTHQVGHFALPPEYDRFTSAWIPVGHYADPVEIARVALFLASDMNTWVVGQTIIADGGTVSAGGWYRTPKRWTNQPLMVQYLEDDPSINDSRPPLVQ
jgi:NAD(P)-dependent dehydrogenase (short-subunit alcohol dehydrogenase family)